MSSLCRKISSCGDGAVDSGEQCDNKNQPGCSFGCKIDQGYNCTSVPGRISVCSFCGNGIV